MTKTVYVTLTQVEAAQLIIKRNKARGIETDETVYKIANARAESAVDDEPIEYKVRGREVG